MVNIAVKTSDKIVWDLPNTIAEIVDAIIHNQDIVIDFLSEGPDIKTTLLNNLLLQKCNQYDYNPQRITIYTSNVCQSHDQFSVDKHAPLHLIEHAQDLDFIEKLISKIILEYSLEDRMHLD